MSSPASEENPLVELGVIARPHGVRGFVKVHMHNPESTALRRGMTVTLLGQGAPRRVAVLDVARGGSHLLVHLEGVADADGAEALRGVSLALERSLLDPAAQEQGEFYCADLVGCRVIDEQGVQLGAVQAVFDAGASDVLVVRDGDRERYIPLVDEWVAAVDLAAREIRISGSADQWESWEA